MTTLLHGGALLLLQLAIILGSGRLLGALMRPLAQPQVVAEIVAGMLVGPTLFGRIAPEWHAMVFPASSLGGLHAISEVGLVLFMFMVGLELDVNVLRRQGRLAAEVTTGTLLVPLASGTALGAALYASFAPEGVGPWAFATFIGIALSVTAFPVLARILAERGMLTTPVGTVALTAAAGHDLAGFVLVGAAVAASAAQGPADVVAAIGITLAYVAAMVLVARPLLGRVDRRFGTLRDLRQTGLAILILAVLLSALAAELVGLHALFGAFLAGIVLPRRANVVTAIRGRLEDITTLVLLPVFFAVTGLETDLAAAVAGGNTTWTVVIVAVSTTSMLAGAIVPALRARWPVRDGVTLGVLANTRGLMELVILTVGMELGLLSPALFAMLVVMAIVNTLMTAPLLAMLYPRDRVLRETTGAAVRAPWTLVACVAHPESARGLGRLAAALCGPPPARGWALRLSTSGESAGLFPSDGSDGEGTAVALAEAAREAGAQLEPVTVQADDVAGTIRSFADLKGADAILLGLHRPLWGGAQLGGPVATIANNPTCDVMVLHDRGLAKVSRVVLGIGGDDDDGARRVAERIAEQSRAELVVVDTRRQRERVDTLVGAARGADLVVVGIGPAWDLPLVRFDVTEPRLLAEAGTSVLAVCSASRRGD